MRPSLWRRYSKVGSCWKNSTTLSRSAGMRFGRATFRIWRLRRLFWSPFSIIFIAKLSIFSLCCEKTFFI